VKLQLFDILGVRQECREFIINQPQELRSRQRHYAIMRAFCETYSSSLSIDLMQLWE
jgi:hypothetical protein